MQLQITNNRYKATNNELNVDPKTLAVSAISYNWWRYVWTDSAGNIVFNDSKYSNTTSRHQSDTRSILRRLGLKVSVFLYNTQTNHRYPETAIQSEINALEDQITELEREISRKGSHKRKNADRQAWIKQKNFRIKDLKRFLSDSLNKKFDPFDAKKRVEETGYNRDSYPELKQSLGRFFLNHKNKVDVNALNEFFEDRILPQLYYADFDELFRAEYPKLTALLSLKKSDLKNIVAYRFAIDLENQIPDIDTDEFIKVQKFCKRQNITRDSLNNFLLDVLHTKLTNLQNRPEKSDQPRIVEKFNYPDFVYSIKHPDHDFVVLDTPAKLRAEGKRQSHCIGGKSYIQDCRYNSMAFNYRGYTFFTDRVGNIKQTHGRFNSNTPYEIELEFCDLVNQQRDSNVVYLSECRA